MMLEQQYSEGHSSTDDIVISILDSSINSDKENEVVTENSKSRGVEMLVRSRSPLSNMQNESVSSVSVDDKSYVVVGPLNPPAIVNDPPVVYEDHLIPVISQSNDPSSTVSYIDEDVPSTVHEPKDDDPSADLKEEAECEKDVENESQLIQETPRTFPLNEVLRNKIVVDPKLTPITPDDSSGRNLSLKSYVAEDVIDLRKDIQLNSLIIKKVEEILVDKSKEYSDKLSLRDTTIAALEKEVEKLKLANVNNVNKSVTMPRGVKTVHVQPTVESKLPGQQTNRVGYLSRTYSLRVSKKDREVGPTVKLQVPTTNSGDASKTNATTCRPSARPANDASKQSSIYATMPRSSKREKQMIAPSSKKPVRNESVKNVTKASSRATVKTFDVKSTTAKMKRDKSKSPVPVKANASKKCGVETQSSSIAKSNAAEKTNANHDSHHRVNDGNDNSVNEGDSMNSKDSGSDPDFVAHVKRLTEEHEKLQVEYARLRLQLVDSGLNMANGEVNKEDDSNQEKDLAEEHKKLQNVVSGYKTEVMRLQDELRKFQRKYWEQKLGTESLGSELYCASKQVVDLIDKFDDATCELAAEKKKCSDIVNQLSNHARKNKTLSVNMEDARHQRQEIQQQMSEIVAVNDKLSRSIKDMESESKETQEFLMAERNAAMESLQEAESELHNSKTETRNLQSMLNDKNEQCRQLLEKLEQKDLYVQMLQAELESTQNRARDMLLSQGAEITGASLALSEISNRIKCVVKSTISANSLNEEEVRKLCKANGIEKDTKHDGIVTNDDDVNNGNDVVHNNATSLVHSVLQAIKNSNNDNAGKYADTCGENDVNGQNFSDVIRPVGFATPFRSISPLKPIQEEDSASDKGSNDGDVTEESSDGYPSSRSTVDDGTASVVNQINSVNVMISKFAVISSVVQDKLKSQMRQLESDKKHLEKQLQNERSNKTETIIELNKKIKNLEMEISVSRRQENILTSAKNKLTSICDGHDKTIKSLTRELQDTRMRNSCLESENREKRQQLTTALDKISNLVSSSNHGYPGIQYVSLSEVLSEKFNLKGEIARLQGQLSENEKLLDEMASKFSRNKSVLESNWQKAEAEVQRLDDVIDSVLNIFRQIPETIEKCEQLSRLWDTLSGNEDINGLNRDRIGSKLIESDVSSSDA